MALTHTLLHTELKARLHCLIQRNLHLFISTFKNSLSQSAAQSRDKIGNIHSNYYKDSSELKATEYKCVSNRVLKMSRVGDDLM